MKHKLIVTTLLIWIGTNALGQVLTVPDDDAAGKLKGTTLAVVLKKEDPDVIKYYEKYEKDPERVAAYRTLITFYNKNIESVVKERWTYTKGVVIISEEKAEELREMRDKAYTILELDLLPPYSTGPGIQSPGHDALKITLASKKKDPICYSLFWAQTKGMLTYQIDHLQAILTDSFEHGIKYWPGLKKEFKTRTPELKKKTILICEKWMAPELKRKLADPKWVQGLGLTVKVVTEDELNAYIVKKDNTTAFVMPVYDDAGYANLGIVTTGDARVAYIKVKASPSATTKFLEGAAEEINE